MKTKLNMIIAIVITFCFTASVLTVIPSQSASKTYNSWADINHDGTVGLSDLVLLANSYGVSGDPSLNVTVTNPNINVNMTNWPATQNVSVTSANDYKLVTGALNFSTVSGLAQEPIIYCGGYSRLSILVNVVDAGLVGYTNYTISLNSIWWYSDSIGDCWSIQTLSSNTFNVSSTAYLIELGYYEAGPGPSSFLTETKAPYCQLNFQMLLGGSDGSAYATLDYAVYLRND